MLTALSTSNPDVNKTPFDVRRACDLAPTSRKVHAPLLRFLPDLTERKRRKKMSKLILLSLFVGVFALAAARSPPGPCRFRLFADLSVRSESSSMTPFRFVSQHARRVATSVGDRGSLVRPSAGRTVRARGLSTRSAT